MRKKSAKKASDDFKNSVYEIEEFLEPTNLSQFSEAHVSWAYDYAVIRLYRVFEDMVLNCLVAAINNDTQRLSETTRIDFPKHLTDEVCEFIIVGAGYFNLGGRDGFIGTLKKYLPDNHYLVTIAKNKAYKEVLEQLPALRNFAAHDSRPAKKGALRAIKGQRLRSSGSWLKKQSRFQQMAAQLKRLGDEIHLKAPY